MKLEFGCGDNSNNISFEKHPKFDKCWLEYYGGTDTIAIDINERSIFKISKELNNGTKYIVADGTNLPFENNYFEIVHEHCVLHHIKNYKKGIEEIARVTKIGGELQLFETVNNFPLYALARYAVGQWENCKIASYYKTDELIEEIKKYYSITSIVYYWQPLFIDIIRYFIKRKLPFYNLMMYFKYYSNKLLKIIKLDKALCGHIYIIAKRIDNE
jgi:ubiquinone/menaquinone biosynthesis C-methylase UbiE